MAPWLWARVAGDAFDLATLGLAFRGKRSPKRNVGIATSAVAGVTALDLLAGRRQTPLERAPNGRGRAVLALRRATRAASPTWPAH